MEPVDDDAGVREGIGVEVLVTDHVGRHVLVIYGVTGGIELAGAIALCRNARGSMVQGDRLLGANGVVSLLFGAEINETRRKAEK